MPGFERCVVDLDLSLCLYILVWVRIFSQYSDLPSLEVNVLFRTSQYYRMAAIKMLTLGFSDQNL